jgi:enoyl-CoA hydratase/carnithine racemase
MQIVEAAGITVAIVAGACAGSDVERLLEADIRLAGDGATFSVSDVRDPVACAVRLTRLLGEAAAKELMLAARTLDAAAALRVGLVTRVVPGGRLGDEAATLLQRLRALPPLALAAVRDAVRAARVLTPAGALALEHDHFCRLVGTEDHKAAVAAFFERRDAAFTGR